MNADNIRIHNYPRSRYVFRVIVNVRAGSTIVYSYCMRDVAAAQSHIRRTWPEIDAADAVRVITHKGEI